MVDDRDLIRGKTALHVSIEKGHKRCVKALLSRQARVDIKDKKGNTPLHLAAIEGHEMVGVRIICNLP